MHRIPRLSAALILALSLTALNARRADATPIANQNYVKQLYLDLLERPATFGELAVSTQLDNATLTRSGLVTALTSSDEYLADQVVDFYQLLLHRAPTPTEGNNFLTLLKSGQTFEQAQSTIAGSGEYFINRGGSTNDGFLDAIYADELNRAVDAPSRTTYDLLLTGGTTRSQVAGDILGSNEYRADLVHAYYNEFLRRSPSTSEVSFGTTYLSTQTDQAYINTILSSDEYYNLAQTIPEPTAAASLVLASLAMIGRRRSCVRFRRSRLQR